MDGEQESLRVDFARLEGKVDAALTGHGTQLQHLETARVDHETRLRRLERALWLAVGASAAGGSVAGSLLARLFGS